MYVLCMYVPDRTVVGRHVCKAHFLESLLAVQFVVLGVSFLTEVFHVRTKVCVHMTCAYT